MAEKLDKEPVKVQTDIVLSEFELLFNELLDQFKTGETGKVVIPVEVLRVNSDKVRFRKNGAAEVLGSFKNKTVSEMRESLDVAED